MKLETKRRLSMLLLAVAVIFWLLRQLAVVYIPVSRLWLWRGPCSCWPPAWTAAAPARRPP